MVVLIRIESLLIAAFAVFGVVSVFGISRVEGWLPRRSREIVVYCVMLAAGVAAFAGAGAAGPAGAGAGAASGAGAGAAGAAGSSAPFIVLAIFLFIVCAALVVSTISVIPRRRWIPCEPVDAIVIMGCGVRPDGSPRRMLACRTGAAFALGRDQRARQGEWPLFVCAGGQGPDEPTTEAQVMGWILHERGVPCDRLVLECHSTDSIENIAFACQVLEQRLDMQGTTVGAVEAAGASKDASAAGAVGTAGSAGTSEAASAGASRAASTAKPHVAFCTSSFHLFRTRREARRQGHAGDVFGSATKWPYWANEIMHVCVLPLYWLLRRRARDIPRTPQRDAGVCREQDVPGPDYAVAARNASCRGMSFEKYLGLND